MVIFILGQRHRDIVLCCLSICLSFWIYFFYLLHQIQKTLHMYSLWQSASTSFSSPEHSVLRVSYCDRSVSGIRLSVNNYWKNLLLWNRPWNFTEMILGWFTFRILQRFEFREELWLPWQQKEKLYKSSCPKLSGLELSYLACSIT